MADDTLVKKRITEYEETATMSTLRSDDVMYVDGQTLGTRKMSILPILNNLFKSSGISVTDANYSTTITDVNSQPVNTIYTYAANLQSKVSNLPSNFAVTILHYTPIFQASTAPGQVMLVIERTGDNKSLYFRTTSGSPAVWSDWQKVTNGSDVEAAITEALNNFNIETDSALTQEGKPADAKAVGDEISDLKADLSEIDDALKVTNETVVNVDTTGATVKTWAGLSKFLVVQKGAIQNKSGKVAFEFYNTSIHSSWAGYPFSFVLLQESNGKLVVVGVMSVPTPNIVGLVSVQTDWIVDSTKVYHIGMWRAGGSYVPYIASSVYGTYTKEIWASADEITVGSEILISSMSNVTGNTIVLNINISSDIGIEVDGIKDNITGLDQQITDAREDIGDLSNLTNPASNLVDAINSMRGSVINLSNVPTDFASTWAGQSKGIFIPNIPIIKKSGLISLNFYNVSNHSSWTGYPFWFILYERTSAGALTVIDKIAVETPSTVGVFTVETGWQITDDKIYYVGVWRAAGSYIPYISGTIETIYKAGVYDTDADISAGSELGLEGLSFADTNTLVMNIFVEQDGKHTESGIIRKRTAHFSVDDAVFWSDLITNQDTYESCFENAQLKMWKNLHDKYGICVTLNCFCSDGTNSIADVPSKFASEFKKNADWLKFAFHAQDASTYYDSDNVDAITASYETFVNGIIAMTGITDAIDPVTRLGFYTGTLANVKAIRDASCGISGLLTSDDVRNSYYLNAEQNAYIQNHDRYIDTDNQLLLLHTMPRLETVRNALTELALYDTAPWQNKIGILEFFTHENAMSLSMRHRVETYCIWCILKGIDFDFACNSLYGLV